MTDRTMLIDQNDGNTTRVPYVTSVAVGLSVADKLVTCDTEDADSSMVLQLCLLQLNADGHWIHPSADIPTSVNGQIVDDAILLSQGSIIEVGDRSIQYKYKIRHSRRSSPDMTAQPPPKPGRYSEEEALSWSRDSGPDDDFMDDVNGDQQFGSSLEDELTASIAIEVRERFNRPLAQMDDDLLNHITSNEQLSSMVASLVVQQAVLATNLQLTASQIDTLFKSFQSEVTLLHASIYEAFIEQYKHAVNGNDPLGVHTPIIILLTELLRITPFPVEHVILWLALLGALSHEPGNAEVFISEKTAAVVMGCMSVHAQHAALQQHACDILAHLALHAPFGEEKAPIREGGVELICRAMEKHCNDLYVLRPACRALAHITNTYAEFTNTALDKAQDNGTPSGDGAMRGIFVLDFTRDRALSLIQSISRKYPSDQVIHTETQRVLSFFEDLYLTPVMEIPDKEPNSLSQEPIQVQRITSDNETNADLVLFTLDASDDDDDDDNTYDVDTNAVTPPVHRATSRVRFVDEDDIDLLSCDQDLSEGGDVEKRDPQMEVTNESPDTNSFENTTDDNESEKNTQGFTSVIKGYMHKLKLHIYNEKEKAPTQDKTADTRPDDTQNSNENKLKAIIPYGDHNASDDHTSQGTTDEEDMTSSQEWGHIHSGSYCKLQKVDSISKDDDIVSANVQIVNGEEDLTKKGYVPRYRKRHERKEDLRQHVTDNCDSELSSSSESIASSVSVEMSLTNHQSKLASLRGCKSMGNLNMGNSDPDTYFSQHCDDTHERNDDDDMFQVEDTSMNTTLWKSEPALNELGNKPKKPRVVSDKIKRCIEKLRDASVSSVRRMSLPGRSRKYSVSKAFPSKYGNDHTFITQPTFLQVAEAGHKDDDGDNDGDPREPDQKRGDTPSSGSTRGFRRSASVMALPREISPPRSYSRRQSVPVLGDSNSASTIKVVDSSAPIAPPRRTKTAPCLETLAPTAENDSTMDLPHEAPQKVVVSHARRRGVTGAMKGYMKNFRRNSGNLKKVNNASSFCQHENYEEEYTDLTEHATTNSNNNNRIGYGPEFSPNDAEHVTHTSLTEPQSKESEIKDHNGMKLTDKKNDISPDETPMCDPIIINGFKTIEDGFGLHDDPSGLMTSHGDVMHHLTAAEQVVHQLNLLLCHTQPLGPAQLTNTLRYAVATTDLPSPSHSDPFLLASHPALGVSLLSMVVDKPMSGGCSLWVLQSVADRLAAMTEVRHRIAACDLLRGFISGPLADSIQGGWGYFTLRRLYKCIESLIQEDDEALGKLTKEQYAKYIQSLTSLREDLERILYCS